MPGTHRVILNLKVLNENVTHQHLKMDTLSSAIRFIKPDSYMASVTLRDAYYSVPVALDDRRFLRFY